MKARLKHLLDKYLQKTATVEDTAALQKLLVDPNLEHEIKQYIGEQLDDSELDGTHRSKIGDSIYERIITYNKITRPKQITVIQMLRYASAAAIVIMAIGFYWFSTEIMKTTQIAQMQENSAPYQYTENVPENKYIVLDDGSTVILNKGSQLIIKRKNGQFNREVELNGEAFFDIKRDPKHPFIVYTGKVKTRVLGTSFNIKSNADHVVVSVTRGLVEVGDDQKVFGKIKPKEQITVSTLSENLEHKISKVEEDITWYQQKLVFKGRSLEEAFAEIGHKFNRKIVIENPKLKRCRVSAQFMDNESLEDILSILCSMREANYTIEPQTIHISGGIPCN